MNNKISLLEKKIGINFKDKKLLIKSLTHKSFNSNNNYEKLEFLGDRVLGLIISKTLLEIFPDDNEGSLDKKLASLVNRKKCCEISKKLNLENFIVTGNAKSKKNKIEDKIISDACEALIGAIYLDQGLSSAEKFILKFWKSSLNLNIKDQVDAKTKLQEYSLKKYKKLPIYKFVNSSGPKHKPIFKIGVRLKNTKFVEGIGNSKQNAEQAAAKLFLKNLNR